MSPAEQQVDNYLSRSFLEMNVRDLVQRYSAAPYGWNEVCTLYVLTELVRRRVRDFVYNNNPHVDKQVVANNLVREQQKFSPSVRHRKIPQEIINDFIGSWKEIFGIGGNLNPEMEANEIQSGCKGKS